MWVSFHFIILVTTIVYCLLFIIATDDDDDHDHDTDFGPDLVGEISKQTSVWQVRPHQLICQIQCHSLRLNGRFQGRSTPFCYFSHWFHDVSFFHHLSPVLFNKMEQAALVMPNSVLCIQSLANPGCEHLRAILPYHSTEFQLILYVHFFHPSSIPHAVVWSWCPCFAWCSQYWWVISPFLVVDFRTCAVFELVLHGLSGSSPACLFLNPIFA